MKRLLKKWITLVAGWVFLVLGVIGLFLPVLQGILFIVIGLVILSTEHAWVHQLLKRARIKFPHVASHVDHAKQYVERFAHHWHRDSAPDITSPKYRDNRGQAEDHFPRV